MLTDSYSNTSPVAPWCLQLACYILLPDGSRRTLHYGPLPGPDDDLTGHAAPFRKLPPGEPVPAGDRARLVTREGHFGRVVSEEYVSLTSRALRDVLRDHFGFDL